MAHPPARFLRDPDLRSALYYDADGRCQGCGAPLEDNWHADHMVPWSVSQRTNVFEMQALCAKCNAKKGAQLPSNSSFDFDPTKDPAKLRPGQRGAITEIITRRRSNEKFTSLVLPTRYGKSDVARLSALQMMSDGLVSNALIVVPAVNLVEQMLADAKLRASAGWYGFSPEAFYPTQTITAPPRLKRLKEAKLSAITTSMANLHIKTLVHWIDMMKGPAGPGIPPVVYMDEAHLGNDGNRWGNICTVLAEAGAHVVVMTATPFRSDGRPIPGFKKITREVLKTTSDGRERVLYVTEPHWETTLEEAMQEDPAPMAQITYQPFGIAGRLDVDDAAVTRVVLDDLPVPAVRRAYREALRDPVIMEAASRFFLVELRNRRREPRQAGTAGIVFVGNHEEEFDSLENEHALNVKGILKRLSPRLRCEIIASSDPSAQGLLDEFIDGKVDVAIVKQMGALGLDVDHLKVALDLSNTRGRAYFHQRMMRIATRWEVPGYPGNPVLTSTYIAPDDRITREMVEATLEGTGLLVPVTEGEGPPPPTGGEGGCGGFDIPPIFTAEEVVLTGRLRDSDGTEAPATHIPVVDSFSYEFPGVAGGVPKGKMTDWLIRAGVQPDAVLEFTEDDVSVPAVGSEPDGGADGDGGNGAKPPAPSPTLNITKKLSQNPFGGVQSPDTSGSGPDESGGDVPPSSKIPLGLGGGNQASAILR